MDQDAKNLTYMMIELLINFGEAQVVAAQLLKNAHGEGREVSPEELKQIRQERTALMADLDDAIAVAESRADSLQQEHGEDTA